MRKNGIIKGEVQSIQAERSRLIQKGLAVPLRLIIKEVFMHLYCRGVMPKSVTQRVFDMFKLKGF